MVLQFVHNQTEEICLEAVRNDGLALQYVNHQTKEICLAAVRNNPNALKYVMIDVPGIEELAKDVTIEETH